MNSEIEQKIEWQVLRELAVKESLLLTQVQCMTGKMAAKTQQLIDNGVFDSYREIHKSYATLAEHGSLEALKRAFFIQWYSVSEPSCFTGIPGENGWGDGIGLDKKTEKAVIELVGHWISLDEELKQMVAWYYQVSSYYFDSNLGKTTIPETILNYLQKLDDGKRQPVFWEEPLEERGQMGEYFLSIFKIKRTDSM